MKGKMPPKGMHMMGDMPMSDKAMKEMMGGKGKPMPEQHEKMPKGMKGRKK